MTKFEKEVKYEKVLKEVEEMGDKLRMIQKELGDDNDLIKRDYSKEFDLAAYKFQQNVVSTFTDLYDAFSHCYSAVRGLKPVVDKLWFDFYAQEYEEEGEENDNI